ncbi:hypothetical protein HMPREF9057_00710 [Actinomyces sp. oral taxon 171 str. F0337]|nr:hypothetical protein HMPREF9057_00710 [Actinomyces sp. oral taxon 171 str. F0337]
MALRLTSRLLRSRPHRGCSILPLTMSTPDGAAARAARRIRSSHATGKQVHHV